MNINPLVGPTLQAGELRRAGATVETLPSAIDVHLVIRPLEVSDVDVFFRYLNDHLADNGTDDTGYFRPRPRSASSLTPDKEQAFRDGLRIPVPAQGWRRVWVARAPDGEIAGHVDLWGHSEPYADHRCLLGLGVYRRYRKRGVGTALLDHAVSWARANTSLEWIDLHVLSANQSAIRLYLRAGFVKVGEMIEMFKLDGLSFNDITMTRRLSGAP